MQHYSSYRTSFSGHQPFVFSKIGVNAKTVSGVRFNRHIDWDLRGLTRQTSSLQTVYVIELTGPKSSNDVNSVVI
jgi:hypothetical protein